MSLVGAELTFGSTTNGGNGKDRVYGNGVLQGTTQGGGSFVHHHHHPMNNDDGGEETDEDDYHPPPTPPGAAEMLFFDNLITKTVSAQHLAQEIRSNKGSSLWDAVTSLGSEGFHSAPDFATLDVAGNPEYDDDEEDEQDDEEDDVVTDLSAYGYGYPSANTRSRSARPSRNGAQQPKSSPSTTRRTKDRTILEEGEEQQEKEFRQERGIVTRDLQQQQQQQLQLDPASHWFGGVKNVWSFGKATIVLRPVLGLTEFTVNGVLRVVAGSSLQDADQNVQQALQSLDARVFNPLLGNVVRTASGLLKPVAKVVLFPLGVFKPKKKDESRETGRKQQALELLN